jgi:hypothetical protein
MADGTQPQSIYLIQVRYYDIANERRSETAFAVGTHGDEALAAWRANAEEDWKKHHKLYLDGQAHVVNVPGYRITLEKLTE